MDDDDNDDVDDVDDDNNDDNSIFYVSSLSFCFVSFCFVSHFLSARVVIKEIN